MQGEHHRHFYCEVEIPVLWGCEDQPLPREPAGKRQKTQGPVSLLALTLTQCRQYWHTYMLQVILWNQPISICVIDLKYDWKGDSSQMVQFRLEFPYSLFSCPSCSSHAHCLWKSWIAPASSQTAWSWCSPQTHKGLSCKADQTGCQVAKHITRLAESAGIVSRYQIHELLHNPLTHL